MTSGQVKTFFYDSRGATSAVNIDIDADIAAWKAATTPTILGPVNVAVGTRNTVVTIMYSTEIQI